MLERKRCTLKVNISLASSSTYLFVNSHRTNRVQSKLAIKGSRLTGDRRLPVDPLHVQLQVPLPAALVAAVRTTSVFLLPTGHLHVLHQVTLSQVRLGTHGARVSNFPLAILYAPDHPGGHASADAASVVAV